jgi:sulfonate transport system substrate-binding protein
MRLTRTGLAAALALALLGGALPGSGPAQAAEAVKIRLSYVVPIANWASMLVEKKDLARNLGKSYQLEITRFAGTPPMITGWRRASLRSPISPTRRCRSPSRTPAWMICG